MIKTPRSVSTPRKIVQPRLHLVDHRFVNGGIVTSDTEHLDSGERHEFPVDEHADLVSNREFPQHSNEFCCQCNAGMGSCNLDDIEQDGQWFALHSKMHGDCHVSAVVRGRPTVRGKIQFPVVFLR